VALAIDDVAIGGISISDDDEDDDTVTKPENSKPCTACAVPETLNPKPQFAGRHSARDQT